MLNESQSADLFFAELFGEIAPRAVAAEDSDPTADRDGNWVGEQPEPFFGDAPTQTWRVVGRPGADFSGLKDDDLIVERSSAGGARTFKVMVAGDVDQQTLFRKRSARRLRPNIVVLRRVRRVRIWPFQSEADAGNDAEVIEARGFFGPNNVRRTEQEVRAAVVARATTEWGAWHTATGGSTTESDPAMFGRLVSYYMAANSGITPDTLTAAQATALGTVNYTALLAAGATPAAIAAEAARLAGVLLAGAPGATDPGQATRVANAISQAREAHMNAGGFSAWSAAFVTACVRGATITLGLEAVITPGRRHIGRDELLLASLTHAGYTLEARSRRAATLPRRQGTYHAFAPRDRAPQPGDIIVQDRRPGITAAQVTTLATLTAGLITHGDIVVEVQPGSVVTIGGNLGDSSRKRRYPLDAQGLPAIDPAQRFTQETAAGALPALAAPGAPPAAATPLAGQTTARIFALLSLVEDVIAVPGQPYGGGILT